MDIGGDEKQDADKYDLCVSDKYDLCVSLATRSDVIPRSGRLFAAARKAADAVSNKYRLQSKCVCNLFSHAPHCLKIAN